ncbi:MAG: hypothetical protein IJY04_05510 [Clostridia bacterium]|nr:hypothetical protein [Clostridia bacterium]
MKEKLVIRNLAEKERIVYMMVKTEAVCMKERGCEWAYSVLILRISDDVVTESDIVYDVSRNEDVCFGVMKELCRACVAPGEAKDAIEAYI